MRFLVVCALLTVSGPYRVWSGDFGSDAKGTASGQFLRLGTSARALGLGEAYVALADEASSVYWNPAGLAQSPGHSALFTHVEHLDSVFFDFGAYSQKLSEAGALGLGVQYLSSGKLIETDISGVELGGFRPNDLAVSLAYAHRLYGYSFGMAGKFIRSQITSTAQTGAVDLGLLSPDYLGGRCRMGFVIQNLGGKLKFDQEAFTLPLVVKLGGSWKLHPSWQAGLEIDFPKDAPPYGALGVEHTHPVGKEFSLAGRLGLNTRTLGDLSGFTGISMGLGLDYRSYGLDYALVPFGTLGLTHLVSVSIKLAAD